MRQHLIIKPGRPRTAGTRARSRCRPRARTAPACAITDSASLPVKQAPRPATPPRARSSINSGARSRRTRSSRRLPNRTTGAAASEEDDEAAGPSHKRRRTPVQCPRRPQLKLGRGRAPKQKPGPARADRPAKPGARSPASPPRRRRRARSSSRRPFYRRGERLSLIHISEPTRPY